jgi:pyrroline-5-carboxylate reductase
MIIACITGRGIIMLDKIIGFIGAGNMGSAMIGGILDSSLATTGQLIASAHSPATLERIKNRFSIETTLSNTKVAERSDVLFLAVKPDKFEEVIEEIAPVVSPSCIVISIAAGKTLDELAKMFARKIKIVRAMPNTPALVGEAMSAICANELVTANDLSLVTELFGSFGRSEVIPEKLMDAVVGVSGSSPAYVYLFIEAMADAAVADGMPRAMAYKFAAQSVYGAAKMVLETGEHPAVLKDAVCSPGGTTIEAVASLEKSGFRDAVITAQRSCSAKSREMSKH